MHPGLKAIYIDIGGTGGDAQELIFKLNRFSLGTTKGSYIWDWKSGPFQSNQFSFIDLTKIVQQDGFITGWDADVASPGDLRLKVWRNSDKTFEVVSQSEVITRPAIGLNHFVLNSPLPVKKGDYIGLYTEAQLKLSSPLGLSIPVPLVDQSPTNLRESALRGLQYDFIGDVVTGPKEKALPSPNPGYSFKVYLSPDLERFPEVGGNILKAILRPYPGRNSYKFEIPLQEFAVDEHVELSIEAKDGSNAFIYPSVKNIGGRGSLFSGLEYGSGSDVLAPLITFQSKPWPFTDIVLLFLVTLGTISMVYYDTSKREYILGIGVLVLAIVGIWSNMVSTNPITQSVLGIIGLLLLPGFMIINLVFPTFNSKFNIIQKIPLWFGLSAALWTIIAVIAYRAQLFSNLILGCILLCESVGLYALYRRRTAFNRSIESSEAIQPFPFKKLYWSSFILLTIIVAVVVGYRAQYQLPFFDTFDHLAGFRKIADSVYIIGGDFYLEPGQPTGAHYASNPWYLAIGLTSRLTHVDVAWMYVIISAIMTTIVLFTFYSVLKVITSDDRIAVIGTSLAIIPWLCEAAVEWRICNSLYFEYLPHPGTLSELIFFPLLTTYCLTYLLNRDWPSWWIVAILAIASMGQHILYVVWVPYVFGFVLAISLFFPSLRCERIKTLILIVFIVFSAVLICYLTLSFRHASGLVDVSALSSAKVGIILTSMIAFLCFAFYYYRTKQSIFTGKYRLGIYSIIAVVLGCLIIRGLIALAPTLSPEALANIKALWIIKVGSIWELSENYFASNPKYLWERGWLEVVGLCVIALLVAFKLKINFEKHLGSFPPFSLSIQLRNRISWRLIAGCSAVLIAPWIIIFNPLIVPWIVKVFNTSMPVFRMIKINTMLSYAILFGAMASILVLFLKDTKSRLGKFTVLLPFVAVVLSIGIPFTLPNVSSAMAGVISNHGWYPSLLNLSNERIYQRLSQLEPCMVATPLHESGYLSVFTPHYLIDRSYNQGSVSSIRKADNEKIINFSVAPDEMRLLLDKYHCRLVIVRMDSSELSRFKAHTELFYEIMRGNNLMVFQVKR